MQERAELDEWFAECDQEEVDIGSVEFMLNHINVDIIDEDGNTALHYAAAYGNVELVCARFSTLSMLTFCCRLAYCSIIVRRHV